MGHSLLIFDTHPIQYRAPVFQQLFDRFTDFKVYFFNDRFDGKKWWFQEVGKVSPQDFGVPLRSGFENSVLDLNQASFFKKLRSLNGILEKEKPRSILIYGYYQIEHWILYFLARKKNIPLIFIGETYEWSGSALRQWLKKQIVGLFFKKVSWFISVGNKTKEYYLSWGIEANKIVEAKYCTDPYQFMVSNEEAQTLREKTRKSLGIPQEAFVVLFVGRLFYRKRPQDLIEIQKSLSNCKDLHTVVVGTGELFDELLAQEKKVERLHLIGFKNQIELKNFYYAADLLLVPSEFETWGLVVNEAFSCGLPALVTDKCGVAYDLVIPGQTGDVFSVGKCKEAAFKIETWVKERNTIKLLGERAREKVLSGYLPQHFSKKIYEAFKLATSEST